MEQMLELTLYQLAIYLGALTPHHGRVRLKADQYAELFPRQARKLLR